MCDSILFTGDGTSIYAASQAVKRPEHNSPVSRAATGAPAAAPEVGRLKEELVDKAGAGLEALRP